MVKVQSHMNHYFFSILFLDSLILYYHKVVE
jgi:hypothetical protein